MGTSYTTQTWHDAPATDTPVSAARLGYMETGIANVTSTAKFLRTRKVWGLGDSLTAGSPVVTTFDSNAYTTSTQGGLIFSHTSWPMWANLASGARWTLAGIAATGGYTAAQILSTHVPQIIAAASPGDTVTVLAGTNGGIFSDVVSIHQALRNAGLYTVAITIPPSSAGTLAGIASFNAQLKNFATANDIPLVDAHALFVDPLTGAYLATYLTDGVHPTGSGFQALGYAIATCLNGLMAPGTLDLVDHNVAFTGSLQGHPLATAATNSTDYTALAGLGTSTMVAPSAKSAFAGGQGYLFTRGDTDINARLGLYTFVAGHKYRIGSAINFQLGGSGTLSMRFESNTTGLKYLWGIGYGTPISGLSQNDTRFVSDFVCPTLPDYQYRLRITLTGTGSTLALGEVTMYDLTQLGIP